MSESGARRVLRDVAANSRGSPPASAFTGFAGLGSGMTKVPMVLLLCLVLAAPILPMAGGVVHAPLPTLASAASHPLAGGAPNALSSSAGVHGLAVPVFHSPGTIYARTLPAGGESPSAGAPTVVEARTGASARLVGVLRPFASLGELPTSTPSGASAAATASPGPALGATGSSMKNGTLGWNGSDYIAGKLYPPDGGLAIGRGYIVEEINANIRIWTTSGTYVTQASLDTFYQSTTGAFLGDTALLYDDQHDHFIALTINITTNLLIFSVSQTSDPTGAWWEYVLPVIGANLPDQPFIGIDSNTFAVTANDAGGAYAYEAWFLNLSDIESGVVRPATQTVPVNSALNCVRPARTYQPSSTIYMAGDNLGGGTTTVSLFVVTGSPPATVTVTEHDFTTSTSSVPQGSQPSGVSVNTDDGRVVGTAWRNGTLWATANDGCGGGSTACSHFWEFDTTTLTLQQDFTWLPPGTGMTDYYAAPAIDSYGDLGVVASFSSSTVFPSVLITGQSVTDPANTLETPIVVKPGYGNEMYGRFGDYNTADVDPTNGVSIWTEGEWIPGDPATDYWGTWIQNFTFTPPSFTVNITVTPAGAGAVSIGGTPYYNGDSIVLLAGSYPLGAVTHAGNRFSAWSSTGGVSENGGTLVVARGGSIIATFVRHPQVVFTIVPTTCAPIFFNGTPVSSGTTGSYDLGSYAARAPSCAGFRFVNWTSTGGVTLTGASLANASASVASNGTLTATWRWIPIPSYTLGVSIGTPACATRPLLVNGSTLSSGGSVSIRAGTYGLSVSPCPQHTFFQWNASGHAGTTPSNLATTQVNVTGNGTISAEFVPTVYRLSVHIAPGNCQVRIGGQVYANGSFATLTAGNYSYASLPCSGYFSPSFALSGFARTNGASQLELMGNGTLSATYPPLLTMTISGTASIQLGSTAFLNASLVGGVRPISLSWRFGDGKSALTTVTSGTLGPASHVYGSGGTFTVHVTANDSSGQEVNATWTVTVQAPANQGLLAAFSGNPWLWVVVVVAIAAVVVAAVYVHRRRRHSQDPSNLAPPESTYPEPGPWQGSPPGYAPQGGYAAPPPPPSWAPPEYAPAAPPPVWPPPPP